jgi:hypothetical protein
MTQKELFLFLERIKGKKKAQKIFLIQKGGKKKHKNTKKI